MEIYTDNILLTKREVELFYPVIVDFGLSKLLTWKLKNTQNLLFKGYSHSQETDIYALGMIMWEISAGEPPFNNIQHDSSLILSICDGSRPEIIEGIPTFLVKLMQRCWDNDPKKRPNAEEIVHEVESGLEVIQKMSREEFYEHLKRDLTKKHPNTVYLSKFISIITNNENSDYEYIIHDIQSRDFNSLEYNLK